MSDVKLTKEQKKAAKAARRAQALAERGDDGEAKKAEALKNVRILLISAKFCS